MTTAFYRTGQWPSDRPEARQTAPSALPGVTPVLSPPTASGLSDGQALGVLKPGVHKSIVQAPDVHMSGDQVSDGPDTGHDPDDVVYVYARLVEEGLTHAEISERLGVTTRTVSRYRERAEKAGLRPVRGAKVNGQVAGAA